MDCVYFLCVDILLQCMGLKWFKLLSRHPGHVYINIYCQHNTVKREMLVAIIFGGFENITIWQRFNLAILFKESGWARYFVIWWWLILAIFFNSPISPNKYSGWRARAHWILLFIIRWYRVRVVECACRTYRYLTIKMWMIEISLCM